MRRRWILTVAKGSEVNCAGKWISLKHTILKIIGLCRLKIKPMRIFHGPDCRVQCSDQRGNDALAVRPYISTWALFQLDTVLYRSTSTAVFIGLLPMTCLTNAEWFSFPDLVKKKKRKNNFHDVSAWKCCCGACAAPAFLYCSFSPIKVAYFPFAPSLLWITSQSSIA